jgi:hypothetical protein
MMNILRQTKWLENVQYTRHRLRTMKTKIFFFDLDGTLLNTEKQITPDTYAALLEWHDAGNLIAISSGRPLVSILQVIKEQKLEGFDPFAVAFNGSQIFSCRESRDIIRKNISLDEVREVSRLAKNIGLHCHSYDAGGILTPALNEEIEFYTRVVKLPIRVLPNFPEGITEPPCKMLCIDLQECGKLDEMISLINSDSLTTIRSNPRYLEVFNSGAGKGTAVKELAKYLGVDIADTCAAGDEENDMSMIEAAGCGAAMCNGNPLIFEKADMITTMDNDHDGLADIIRHNI